MADLGIGDMVGGVFGAALNTWNAERDRAAAERARRQKANAITNAGNLAQHDLDNMLDILEGYNQNRIKLADQNDVTALKDVINSYSPQTYDFDKFGDSYTKTIDDFLNPEAEKIANLAGLETQAGLAGQGAAKGTGALAGMGYSRWKAAEDLYKDAQSQMLQVRSQAYKEYGDYIDRMQAKLDTISQGQLDKAKLLSGLVQNEQTQQGDYMSDLLGVLGDKAQTKVNTAIGAFS
jgi:hypothetical protein